MNLAELMELFRVKADDTIVPYLWKDNWLVTALQHAEIEAAIRAKLIFDKTTEAICQIAVTAATAVYDISPLIVQVQTAYLVDANDKVIPLEVYDRYEMNRLDDDWRTTEDEPTGLIVDDNQVELNCIPEADYTLYLEVYRLPVSPMSVYQGESIDSPEISAKHHPRLIDWALYEGYLIPDSDTYDEKAANKALDRFEKYFGLRPKANTRKRQSANRPHRNKCWW